MLNACALVKTAGPKSPASRADPGNGVGAVTGPVRGHPVSVAALDRSEAAEAVQRFNDTAVPEHHAQVAVIGAPNGLNRPATDFARRHCIVLVGCPELKRWAHREWDRPWRRRPRRRHAGAARRSGPARRSVRRSSGRRRRRRRRCRCRAGRLRRRGGRRPGWGGLPGRPGLRCRRPVAGEPTGLGDDFHRQDGIAGPLGSPGTTRHTPNAPTEPSATPFRKRGTPGRDCAARRRCRRVLPRRPVTSRGIAAGSRRAPRPSPGIRPAGQSRADVAARAGDEDVHGGVVSLFLGVVESSRHAPGPLGPSGGSRSRAVPGSRVFV